MLVDSLLRPLFTPLLKRLFRIEVSGVENIEAAGDRVVIIANHLSFLDPIILAAFVPGKPTFAINVYQADKWYFNWLDKLATLYRLDPLKPLSMKRMIQDLRPDSKGTGEKTVNKVIIFPEGRISTSGGIMKIYEGAGMLLEKTGATLVTARIDGTQYSKMSRMGGKLRLRWFPKIRLTFMPPVPFEKNSTVPAATIYRHMTEAALHTSLTRQSFLEAALQAYEVHGGKQPIACDIARIDMNYRQFWRNAWHALKW